MKKLEKRAFTKRLFSLLLAFLLAAGVGVGPGGTVAGAADEKVFSLIYKPNYGANTTYAQFLNNAEGTALNVADPVRAGYTFEGWYDNPAGTGTPQIEPLMPDLGVSGTVHYRYAKWQGKAYTIAFDGNGDTGGAAIASIAAVYGDNVTLPGPGAMVNGALNFLGWAGNAAGTGPLYAPGLTTLPPDLATSGTATLYAKCGTNGGPYTVMYHSNATGPVEGGMGNRPRTWGDALALDANAFVRPGYHLLGWANTAAGAPVYADGQGGNINPNAVSGGVNVANLYAVWAVNTYVVQYNANGSTGTMNDSPRAIGDGGNLNACRFQKTGNTFLGWALSSGSTTAEFPDRSNTHPAATLTANAQTVALYAVWTPITYSVVYNSNGGDGGSMDNTQLRYGQQTNLTDCRYTRRGHDFLGWNSNRAQANAGTVEFTDQQQISNLMDTNGSITLYAVWKPYEYNIKYVSNKPAGAGAEEVTVPRKYNDNVPFLSADTFARTGYTCVGWTLKSDRVADYQCDAVENPSKSSTDSTALPKNGETITLYAVWQPFAYIVRFSANGGFMAINYPEQSRTFDDARALPGVGKKIIRDGYTFSGWSFAEDGAVNFPDGSRDNIIVGQNDVWLYAIWQPNTYTVKFDPNGGTGSMPAQPRVYDDDEDLTRNTFTKTGYTFLGWGTSSKNPSVDFYDAENTPITIDNKATVTLYAQWAPNAYTVRFNGNGGTGVMPSQGRVYDDGAMLNANRFRKPDHAMAGWATSETEAAGGVVQYADSAKGNLSAELDGEVFLWAVWKKTEIAIYKAGLIAKLAEAETLNKDDYTAGSWQALQTAKEEAQQVRNNEEATRAEVDAALKKLQEAMDALKRYYGPMKLLRITPSAKNPVDWPPDVIQYKGAFEIEVNQAANFAASAAKNGKAIVQLETVNESTVKVTSLKRFFRKSAKDLVITATAPDAPDNSLAIPITVKPSFVQYLIIVLLFGWIWY